MWLQTTIGFFSIVQKDGEPDLTVRARVREARQLIAKTTHTTGRERDLAVLEAAVEASGSAGG